jgi:hypothetical protein
MNTATTNSKVKGAYLNPAHRIWWANRSIQAWALIYKQTKFQIHNNHLNGSN